MARLVQLRIVASAVAVLSVAACTDDKPTTTLDTGPDTVGFQDVVDNDLTTPDAEPDTTPPDADAGPDVTADTKPPQCTADQDCAEAAAPPLCQEAWCDAGECKLRPVSGQPSCDDGDACTDGDTCLGGTCVGQALSCGDDNPCTMDSCDAASGCVNTPVADGPCDDGDLCTTGDHCDAGQCVGDDNPLCECNVDADCEKFEDGNGCNGTLICQVKKCVVDPATVVTCPASGDPCTTNACKPSTGQCATTPKEDGSGCSDGDACTVGDACQAGACVGQAITCDDGNACTDDACDEAEGCVFTPNTAPCDDGDLCTTGDACSGGVCQGTDSGSCQCTDDSECAPFEDGNLCNGTLVCNAGKCEVDPATKVTCDATGDACQTATCAPATGTCSTKAALDGTACDDGDACTAQDTCSGGVCGGVPLSCNDNNQCTDDSCDPVGGCVNAPNSAPCDDGDPCTTNDMCGNGSCGGFPDPSCGCVSTSDCVDDGNKCNGTPICQGGQCVTDPSTVVTCQPPEGVKCKVAVCAPATGACSVVDAQDGTSCDDGSACTTGDACVAGSCKGAPKSCDDGNVCTTDSCNPSSGCTSTYNNQPCDDGNDCTENDACQQGECKGSAVAECVCATTADCAAFEDGDVCNGTLVCSGSKCVVDPDTVVTCDTSGDTACKTTLCDPGTGTCAAVNAVDGKPCSDGTACTTGDACQSGACVGGPALACDDGNPCTNDSCDAGLGCLHVNNTAACDDGDACTEGDACAGGVCQPGATNACPGSCSAAWTLSCGGQDTWSTLLAGATDAVESYPCTPSTWTYPAPEYTYSFTAPYAGTFTVTMSNEDAITDALILAENGGGCDPTQCVDYAEGTATVDMAEGDSFRIVVDGWNSEDQAGGYTINLDCTPDVEQSCDDGVDEDEDGATDCLDTDCAGDPVCAPESCNPVITLGCGEGDTSMNNATGSTDAVDSYGCSPYTYSAPEFTYRYSAAESGPVTVTLSGETASTDVIVLEDNGSCDPAACVDYGLTSVTFDAVAGQDYLIVVDGFLEAVGSFTLDISCTDPSAVEVCDNGTDDDGDGEVDCLDTDCATDTACGTCTDEFTLSCGATDDWTTEFNENLFDEYACLPWSMTGPEYVYVFTPSASASVTITLTEDPAGELTTDPDHDLIVLQETSGVCSPSSCVDYGLDSVTFDAVAGETYYIVIDGWQGSEGPYALDVTCL